MKTRIFSFVAMTSFVLVAACQTSPTGRKQFAFKSAGEMDKMGVQAFEETKKETPIEKDPATNAYVRCIAGAITNALPEKRDWEVVVFKDETANAFALPGGKIGVHTGILKVAATDAQLAAVLGHEVGHVLAQHSNERVSQAETAEKVLTVTDALLQKTGSESYKYAMGLLGLGAQYGVLMPYGRLQESEADVIGLELMAKAGFDPHQAINLWENMSKAGGAQPPQFLSTHPSNDTRISNLKSHMDKAVELYNASGKHTVCRR